MVFGIMLVVIGCRGGATFIADERKDSVAESESEPTDTFDSNNETTDTLADSDSETVDCDGLSIAPGDTVRTLEVDGITRTYVLHIPDTYTGLVPAPLLFEFHAGNGSGSSQLSRSIYPSVTDSQGVIMAFPSGLSGDTGVTGWNIGPCCVKNVDDVAFTIAVIDDIKKIACIDPSRIYAAGIYTGGGMAYYLACKKADVFAAVVSSAFDLNEQTVDDCTPERPISIVSFRSSGDPIMDWEGGPGSVYPGSPLTFLGAEDTFEQWAKINGCTGESSDFGNGCQQFTNTQCEGNVEVLLCTEQGVSGDAGIAWSVLRRHTLP